MPKYFPSFTHTIVNTVLSITEMSAMKGIMAFAEVCFGPGDDNAINLIAIKKIDGPVTGAQAHIPKTPVIKDGKTSYLPVFTGKAADELKMIALVAFDQVKQIHGLKFNKRYRVVGKTVEEINDNSKVCQSSKV